MPDRASGRTLLGDSAMAAGRDARWGKETTVARAKRAAYAGIWAGFFTGLMLSPAGAEAASSVADLTISVQTNVVGQAPSRPRAQTALSAAIESNRRGDYEQAALHFAQAQAGKDELSAKEQEELTSWLDKYRLGQLWTKGQIGGTRW